MDEMETSQAEPRRLGWLRLMDVAREVELSVVQWYEGTFHLFCDTDLIGTYASAEEAFSEVARRVAENFLGGAWINGYELPEGWSLGLHVIIRPQGSGRSADPVMAPEAPKATPVEAWLERHGWSVYEAALRTGLSRGSLHRWRRGVETDSDGTERPTSAPGYAVELMRVIDSLVELGQEIGRWDSHRLTAIELRHWLDRHAGSQARAAQRLGVARSQVSAWINGRAVVPAYISRLIQLLVLQAHVQEVRARQGADATPSPVWSTEDV